MTQKAIKIKIKVGNGASGRRSAALPSGDRSDDVIIRPNYQGIFVLLVIVSTLFGGGWWLFSSDEIEQSAATVASSPPVQEVSAPTNKPVSVVVDNTSSIEEKTDTDTSAAVTKTPEVKKPHVLEQVIIVENKTVPESQPEVTTVNQPSEVSVAKVEKESRLSADNVAASQETKPAPAEPKVEKTPVAQVSDNRVARAQFTRGISKREPVDKLQELSVSDQQHDSVKLYFFSELKNLKGQTVTHRWLYEDEEVANIKFRVGGNRWRVYSSKNIQTHKSGAWSVTVNDSEGNVIYREEIAAR